MPKYRITESHIDTTSNHEKLKADGFTHEDISRAFYKATAGANPAQRRYLMGKLYGHMRNRPKGV